MKLIFLSIVAAFSMGQKMPKPDPMDSRSVVQGLQAEKQKQNQWCAAAAARLMMSSKTKSLPSQCDIVRKVLNRDCFNTPITTEAALRAYGFKAQKISPSFDRVVREIKNGKPVTIYHLSSAGTSGESGHAVVAYGTFNHKGRDYILVYDPYYGRVMTWDSSYTTGNLQWYALVVFL